MAKRVLKTFNQYRTDRLEANPELASAYEETKAESELARALIRRREELDMTQRQLAAKSGIAQPVIARIEREAEVPTIVTLQKLARALDAKVEITAERIEIRSQGREVTPQETFAESVRATYENAAIAGALAQGNVNFPLLAYGLPNLGASQPELYRFATLQETLLRANLSMPIMGQQRAGSASFSSFLDNAPPISYWLQQEPWAATPNVSPDSEQHVEPRPALAS